MFCDNIDWLFGDDSVDIETLTGNGRGDIK